MPEYLRARMISATDKSMQNLADATHKANLDVIKYLLFVNAGATGSYLALLQRAKPNQGTPECVLTNPLFPLLCFVVGMVLIGIATGLMSENLRKSNTKLGEKCRDFLQSKITEKSLYEFQKENMKSGFGGAWVYLLCIASFVVFILGCLWAYSILERGIGTP